MFRLVKIVQCEDLSTQELLEFLDARFHPELASKDGINTLNEEASQQRWGDDFTKQLPKDNHELLFYISQSTTAYPMQNCVGRVCLKYVWREFFKAFPLGRIMLVELSMDWLRNVWQGERDLASQMGFALDNPLATPQGMSGLQAENFPLNTLPLGASGIYPLTLFDAIHTSSDLVVVYVPDRAIVHAQMLDNSAYSSVLWRLHHIFDDQWTFDSFRGPKSAASECQMNPIKNIDYFAWMFEKVSERMADVLAISDPLRRGKLCMTFSRAVCDCVLCITAQLPYMAKTFFFACLDKLCNLSLQIRHTNTEIDAWNSLTDYSFLSGDLDAFMKSIPDPAGYYLRETVDWSAHNMQIDQVTPEVLRDIRNSHHGYELNPAIVSRLFASSGELHNDITLLATPLVLYFLGQKWD